MLSPSSLNASREGVTMQWTIYAHPLGPLGLTKSFSLLKNFFWKQPNVRSNTVWSKGLSRTSFHTSITTTRSLKITLDNFFYVFFLAFNIFYILQPLLLWAPGPLINIFYFLHPPTLDYEDKIRISIFKF